MTTEYEMVEGPAKPAVEPIRSKPLWLARLLNRVVGWTEMYCSGGCGYPVRGIYGIEVERQDKTPIKFYVCGAATECAKSIERLEMHDETGARYSEVRPHLLEILRNNDIDGDFGIFLSR